MLSVSKVIMHRHFVCAGLFKSITRDDMLKYISRLLEEVAIVINDASKKVNKAVYFTSCCDLIKHTHTYSLTLL